VYFICNPQIITLQFFYFVNTSYLRLKFSISLIVALHVPDYHCAGHILTGTGILLQLSAPGIFP
jgi:hypothetical protein